jgi:hypothetical protein
MLQTTSGKDALPKPQICRWFSRLKKRQTSMEDEECCGHPATSKVDEKVQTG